MQMRAQALALTKNSSSFLWQRFCRKWCLSRGYYRSDHGTAPSVFAVPNLYPIEEVFASFSVYTMTFSLRLKILLYQFSNRWIELVTNPFHVLCDPSIFDFRAIFSWLVRFTTQLAIIQPWEQIVKRFGFYSSSGLTPRTELFRRWPRTCRRQSTFDPRHQIPRQFQFIILSSLEVTRHFLWQLFHGPVSLLVKWITFFVELLQ